jgi:hypothetical protein
MSEGETATTSTVPGWYADPWRPEALRWWDGGAWTGHIWPASVRSPGAGPGPAARRQHPRRPGSTGNQEVATVFGLIVCAGIGVFVFGMGVHNAVQAFTWHHTVATAEMGACGTDQWANDSGGATRCSVAVTFRASGRVVHATITDVDPSTVHGTGVVRHLDIYYDPNAPTDVDVDGTPNAWTVGCLVVGVLLIGLALRPPIRWAWKRRHRVS